MLEGPETPPEAGDMMMEEEDPEEAGLPAAAAAESLPMMPAPLSALPWPELDGLELNRLHKFSLPQGRAKKARTVEDDWHSAAIGERSAFGGVIMPTALT
jgi:hypothetical protein